jgi:hypothetical protein
MALGSRFFGFAMRLVRNRRVIGRPWYRVDSNSRTRFLAVRSAILPVSLSLVRLVLAAFSPLCLSIVVARWRGDIRRPDALYEWN